MLPSSSGGIAVNTRATFILAAEIVVTLALTVGCVLLTVAVPTSL